MQKLQFLLLFQCCLAYDWKYYCSDCNTDNIYGRDCNRGPKFCTDCLDAYVENFDASKATTYDVPVEKSTWSKVHINGRESDFVKIYDDCTEDDEDLCKYKCFNLCNEHENCWTGYGYKEGSRYVCKWTSSKSWTFDSAPSSTSRGALQNLSMFRKMNIGKAPFAEKIRNRSNDIIYNQLCHAKKTTRSLATNDYPIPMQCRDYASSCLFGFVVDGNTNRIKQDWQGRCICADPFKVVDGQEKSNLKIDKDFHFGDIRIFTDEGELEKYFVCIIWQKSLESDKQISNLSLKIDKPDTIGGSSCKLRANPKNVELWNDYYCDGYLIPYELSQERQEKLRGPAATRVERALQGAILHLEETTQIRLIPVEEFLQKTGLKDAFSDSSINYENCDKNKHMCHKISFANTGGFSCSSLVGKNAPMMVHKINLGPRYCHSVFSVLHELLHAFSFMHEHTRPDRDNYIRMFSENYPRGQEHNFAILPAEEFNSRANSYFDFDSIMLYSPAAGNTGDPTWERLDGKPYSLSDNPHVMSKGDIETLNSLYPKKNENFCRRTFVPVIGPTVIETCPVYDFERINYNLCFDSTIASQCRDYCDEFIKRMCPTSRPYNNRGPYNNGGPYSNLGSYNNRGRYNPGSSYNRGKRYYNNRYNNYGSASTYGNQCGNCILKETMSDDNCKHKCCVEANRN